MKIIDDHSLLSQQQIDLLKQCAAIPFSLGAFGSIDDMLTTLKVDVIIEPGIITRSIPRELEEAQNYWNAQKSQADDYIEEIEHNNIEEIVHNLWIINQNIEVWQKMPLRGLYDPKKNQIKLFPEELQQEYGGQKMDELLVSTLVHEAMHAYFNRPQHKCYPYAIFVEEPLAEYGMLLYLHETKSIYYNWAYDDVSSKNTCYKYGAVMMDQYLSGNTTLREYLESYKILIDKYAIPSVRSNTIVLPKHGVPSSIVLEGKKVSPKWCKLWYFYDKQTKTLGFDGDWRGIELRDFMHMRLMDMRFSHDEPENIYIAEDFQCDDFDTFSEKNVIVSPNNYTFTQGKMGVAPKWCKLLYFYDKRTKTLGFDGDWRGIELRDFMYSLMHMRLLSDEPENIYIAEGFQCDDFHKFTFSEKKLIVSPNNKIFKQGKMDVALLRKDNTPFLSSCGDGLYRICRNGLWGVVDKQLQVIVPLKYGYVWSWDKNELAWVVDRNTNPHQYGLVNKQGQEQVPLIYEGITDNSDGTYTVKRDGQEYTIDKYGKRIN